MEFETFAINTYEEPPQAVVLQLTGELDLVCEPALQEVLDGLSPGPERSFVVDLSETQFMGVGPLRRIVLAGWGFASTEFRSPAPIVKKVLRVFGCLDGAAGIEAGIPGTCTSLG